MHVAFDITWPWWAISLLALVVIWFAGFVVLRVKGAQGRVAIGWPLFLLLAALGMINIQ